MTAVLPRVILVRHGQTEWSLSGQHTGHTDLPLTPTGEAEAATLANRIGRTDFAGVFTSPSQRARRTASIAGFEHAVVDGDLAEWNYGQYEGLKSAEIAARQPGWNIFVHGCPGGESAADMTARADRVVARLRAAGGDCLIFTSGHIGRCIAARWVGQPITMGHYLLLSTASLSVLSYDHSPAEPAILKWNQTAAP